MTSRKVVGKELSTAALKRVLAAELGGHISMHLERDEPRPLRVLESARASERRSSKPGNTFVLSQILPVYTGSCGSVAQSGIDNLKKSGLVVLVKSPEGKHLYVEVEQPAEGPKLIRVSSGGIVEQLEKALKHSANADTARRRERELRILRVPAMHLSVVWRHVPGNNDANRFVAYTPNFTSVKIGRVYRKQRINSLLKRYATEMILRWYKRYEAGLTQVKA